MPTFENTQAVNQLIVFVHSGQMAAWMFIPGQSLKVLLIKGESRLTLRDSAGLASAFTDLSERLRGDGVALNCIHWIADTQGRAWCAAVTESKWQLPWEWLAMRFGLANETPWDDSIALEQHVLPWLITADDRAQREQLQLTREREHMDETKRLSVERVAISRENEQLRAENAALQQIDAEFLASFLPALYPRVFTVIGPADLSLLCGRVEPVQLPSPYPEPVEETLRVLQKRFRALQPTLQKQIVGFVMSLPQSQRLQGRPEMRELIEELKGLNA